MSHGHDIYNGYEAQWFNAFVSGENFTRKVYAFAMSHDDARESIEAAFGPVGTVTRGDGPPSGFQFLITESAQTTRQIWTKGIGVHV